MPRLHIFNPEHDIALPYSPGAFTPSRGVRAMKRVKSLLPALYASAGDCIMVPEEIEAGALQSLPFYEEAQRKKINIITGNIHAGYNMTSILPWGWDAAVVSELKRRGVDASLLPSQKILKRIKELSHRRISIQFHEYFKAHADFSIAGVPQEFFSVEDAVNWAKQNPGCYFKSPWSSSGYGVFRVHDTDAPPLRERIRRVITSQGSIMGEENYPHGFDMATEWIMTASGAEFIGFSVFDIIGEGSYKANREASQEELTQFVAGQLPVDFHKVLRLQKGALNELAGDSYRGPLGIDMLVANDGRVNMCVEVNLRMTMGHVEILKNDNTLLSKYADDEG